MLVSEEVSGRAQQNILEFVCRCVRTLWDVSTHCPWALSPQRSEDTESWDQLYGAGALRTESKQVLQQNPSSSFHFLIFFFFFLKQKCSSSHEQATAGSSGCLFSPTPQGAAGPTCTRA